MAMQSENSVATGTLDSSALEAFRGRLRGAMLEPSHNDYEGARRIQNGLIDRHPAVIVRCSGPADVVEAVNFARDRGVLLSIRGGGHNVAGNAVNDGGIVIDLTAMRGVHVDAATATVRAAGGATWSDVDRETQLFGLAIPGGVVSTTGVAGLTLHGGYGHLRRTFGLSIDNLLSVQIVTADGQVRTASATENADLFWAVRGAGSNFGVVTSFEFRAHPVGPIVQLCAPFYALEDGGKALRAWREFTATAPDEINSLVVVWSVPDVDAFPAELRRRPVVILATVYVGPPEEGARIMQPLREVATPLLDLSGPMPYTVLQASFDPFFPKGRFYYWKSTNVHDLSDACIDTILAAAADRPSHMSDIPIWHLGGAMSRVAPEATAYGRRDAPYLVTAEATWTDSNQNEANIHWARDLVAAMRPFSRGGLYLNFPGFGEEKEAMLRDAYGANYDRLQMLKTQYDPGNLFRMNLNIGPATSAASV
jgi:FAD/FMN-containing dehydrogenase